MNRNDEMTGLQVARAVNLAVKDSSIEEIEKHIQKMIAFQKQNHKINQQ
jgi:hypothetical protein